MPFIQASLASNLHALSSIRQASSCQSQGEWSTGAQDPLGPPKQGDLLKRSWRFGGVIAPIPPKSGDLVEKVRESWRFAPDLPPKQGDLLKRSWRFGGVGDVDAESARRRLC